MPVKIDLTSKKKRKKKDKNYNNTFPYPFPRLYYNNTFPHPFPRLYFSPSSQTPIQTPPHQAAQGMGIMVSTLWFLSCHFLLPLYLCSAVGFPQAPSEIPPCSSESSFPACRGICALGMVPGTLSSLTLLFPYLSVFLMSEIHFLEMPSPTSMGSALPCGSWNQSCPAQVWPLFTEPHCSPNSVYFLNFKLKFL